MASNLNLFSERLSNTNLPTLMPDGRKVDLIARKQQGSKVQAACSKSKEQAGKERHSNVCAPPQEAHGMSANCFGLAKD